MNGVPDAELAAGRLDDGSELRIVDVTHPWKEMVLDLVVEAKAAFAATAVSG
jgi:hypothetical protein